MNRDEARAQYIVLLLHKIREDTYPSTTQMTMVEEALQSMPGLADAYVQILQEKVAQDKWPSIDMLRRLQAACEHVPR